MCESPYAKIITINEHQHLNNDHLCSFCGDTEQPVVGRAYFQQRRDYPAKHYLFSYCARCALIQAEKMVKVVHPKYEVHEVITKTGGVPC